MAVWATDSFDGIPAGTIHIEGRDDYGRPSGPVCGASRDGLWFFAGFMIGDVPPWWRCPACREAGRERV